MFKNVISIFLLGAFIFIAEASKNNNLLHSNQHNIVLSQARTTPTNNRTTTRRRLVRRRVLRKPITRRSQKFLLGNISYNLASISDSKISKSLDSGLGYGVGIGYILKNRHIVSFKYDYQMFSLFNIDNVVIDYAYQFRPNFYVGGGLNIVSILRWNKVSARPSFETKTVRNAAFQVNGGYNKILQNNLELDFQARYILTNYVTRVETYESIKSKVNNNLSFSAGMRYYF